MKSNSLPRPNPWHEYFYQPERDEPPAVSGKFWKSVGYGLLFSLPFWIVAVLIGLEVWRKVS